MATLEEIKIGKIKYLIISGVLILLFIFVKSIYSEYASQEENWKKRNSVTKDIPIEVNDRSIYDIDQTTAMKNAINEVKNDVNEALLKKDKENEKLTQEIIENQKKIDEQQKEMIVLRNLVSKEENNINKEVNNELNNLKDKLTEQAKELERIKKEKELNDKLKPNDLELPQLKGALAETLKSDIIKDNPIDLKLDELKVVKSSGNEFFKLGSEKQNEEIEENNEGKNKKTNKKNIEKDNDKKEEDIPLGPKMDLMLGLVDATLVMGVDAPTNIGTKNSDAKDPLPVLLSVSSDAIIANNYRQDYKNCLILATATGNATTERAYLRLSKLSCVSKNGERRVESEIEGWVVGEDNKTGVSGNLVTKSGTLILKGLMAGIAEGLANATSNTNNYISPTTSYGNNNYSPANNLAEGFGTGAGNAFKTIADFYIEMAKDMYPVIEVRGGRKVQILIKGSGKTPIREIPYNKMFINSDYELDVNQNVTIQY